MIKQTAVALLMTCGLAFAEPSPTPSNGDDNLKNALAELVKSTTKTIDTTKVFVAEQTPELFKQYLVWSSFKTHIWIWSSLVVAIALAVFGVVLLTDNEMGGGWPLFFSIALFFGLTVPTTCDLVKINKAPNVYLLEYAKSLTK